MVRLFTFALLLSITISARELYKIKPGPPAKDSTAYPERTREDMTLRKYFYLLKTNEEDIQKHSVVVSKLKKRIAQLAGDKKQTQNIRKYQATLVLYESMIELNQAIIDQTKEGQISTVMSTMEDLVKLEKQIETVTGRQPEREWLTFAEMHKYRDARMVSRSGHPEAMPFLKSQWKTLESTRK